MKRLRQILILLNLFSVSEIDFTRDKINDYDEEISENIKKCTYQKLDLSNHDNLEKL